MEAMQASYNLICGVLLNPILVLVKHYLLPATLEDDVSKSFLTLISLVSGMLVSFIVNAAGSYNAPTMLLILMGMGVQGTSQAVNILGQKAGIYPKKNGETT